MRHAFRPTLTTLALATLMAGCASSGSSSSGYYATALTNISGAKVNLTGNRLDAWVGCNHLSANARPDEARLDVGDIASTQMACQPSDERREKVLAEFLKRGPKLDKTGDMWLLRDNVHAVVVHTNTDPQLTHASFGPNPAATGADNGATESALAMDRAIERESLEQAASRPAPHQQAPQQQAQQVAATPAPRTTPEPAPAVRTAATAPQPSAPEPVAERPHLQFYSQVGAGAPVTRARSRAMAQAPAAEPVDTAPERSSIGMSNEIHTGNTVAPARTVAQAPVNTAPERAPIGMGNEIRTGDTVAPAPARTVAQAPAAAEPINTASERAPVGLGNEIRTGDTVAPAPARTVAQAPTTAAEPINTAAEQEPIALNGQIQTGDTLAPAQQAQVAQSRSAPRGATTMALAPSDAVQATRMTGEVSRDVALQSPRLDLWQQMGADGWQLAPQHTPSDSAPWQPAVETSRLAWFASLLKGDTASNLPDVTVTAPREIRSYAVRESNQWVLYSGEPIDQAQQKVLSDEPHQQDKSHELTERDSVSDKGVITTSRLDESALERGVRATTSRALSWLSARWQA
ncbi:Heat shock protein HslJ [Kushneria avicenniae]|uniref:Heat shock protein HslJ n=1 Tax=Kushneria avicenniae TaxID=402385 RepID=A0A1I1LXF6_9GAMM|nr:META domain-containing protein [Kushneria avicenniae]SFC75003.1 Heat shock protein HslJ [Kushneria avicenniae]